MNCHKLFLLPVLALSTILFSCSTPPQQEEQLEEKVEQVLSQAAPEEEPPCPIQNSLYPTYQKAVSEIRNGNYEYSDSKNMASSSWVKSAEFYSCDAATGCLIMTTKANRDYIHFGVPMDVWKMFKSASSYGSYYSRNLKGRYSFIISN
jgi:hypothetical protein